LTDQVKPPLDPLKAAIWRADNVNDARMKSLLVKAQIALGETVSRPENKALVAIEAARLQAVPIAEGLQAMRANCRLWGGRRVG